MKNVQKNARILKKEKRSFRYEIKLIMIKKLKKNEKTFNKLLADLYEMYLSKQTS